VTTKLGVGRDDGRRERQRPAGFVRCISTRAGDARVSTAAAALEERLEPRDDALSAFEYLSGEYQ